MRALIAGCASFCSSGIDSTVFPELRLPAAIGMVVLTMMLAATAREARAQGTSSTAPDAEIVPPRLLSVKAVEYPANATGNAVVVLALTVNRDGSVREARAVQGAEPFAAAAVAAAYSWQFEPATRGDVPIAAIIRFEVEFTAPEPIEPAPELDAGVPPAASPPELAPAPEPAVPPRPAPAEPMEVVVHGERRAPGVTTLGRAEVRELPGAFGDPFRAIEALPGVTPIVSGLPFFYIRGAPPGNVGYFLDGVRVPYLYHIGLGPSIVNPAIIERVDLYPGGYPARFGRFTGGIVAGETTAPRTDMHGEGNLRVFDLGGVVESGFANDRGTVLLGGRYSYTATVLSLIVPDIQLDYRDYQARVSYDVTPRDRVSAFAFGSYDLLGQEQPQGLRILFGSEFYRLDLRYDHWFGGEDTLRYAVTLGFDQTNLDVQRNAQNRMLGSRVELVRRLSRGALLRGGADAVIDSFEEVTSPYVDPEDPTVIRFSETFPPRSDLAMGVWADLVLTPSPELEVIPGVRADLFTSGGAAVPSIDARLAGKLKLADHLKLVHAYGIVHQPPSFIVPVPGLVPGKLKGGLQTSAQTSTGVEAELPDKTKATAAVFYNAFFDMSDTLGTAQGEVENFFEQRSLGWSYGLELHFRRPLTRKLGGYVSYTLSRSMRSIGRETFPNAFDRTHVASGAVGYDLGRRWRAGTRVVFYTGIPKRPDQPSSLLAPPRTSSPDREPAFYRVDVRLEKRWVVGKTSWLAFVAEVMNVTLNKETIANTEIGPVTIPSIGLEGGF